MAQQSPTVGSPVVAPGVVFLGGFRSDMTGTKASFLEEYCRRRGHAFVRFDYFGHGASSGDFALGTIGRWAADTVAVLDALTEGPQILVGSSMGGWIMLLAALARTERIQALIGVAAAPDFTEDLVWPRLDAAQRKECCETGAVTLPSKYDPVGHTYRPSLFEDGRRHLVMRAEIPLACPVRLLHGLLDDAVPWQTSLRLAERLTKPRRGGHARQRRRPPAVERSRSQPARRHARRTAPPRTAE